MLARAKPTAHQPYIAMSVASLQLGATAIRSRATSQMHTYGPKLNSCENAERAMPKYVRNLRSPAYASSSPMPPPSFFDPFAMRFLSNGLRVNRKKLIMGVLARAHNWARRGRFRK